MFILVPLVGRAVANFHVLKCLMVGYQMLMQSMVSITVVTGTPRGTQASLTRAPSTSGKMGRPDRDHARSMPHLRGRDRPNVARGSSRWSREREYKTQPSEA